VPVAVFSASDSYSGHNVEITVDSSDYSCCVLCYAVLLGVWMRTLVYCCQYRTRTMRRWKIFWRQTSRNRWRCWSTAARHVVCVKWSWFQVISGAAKACLESPSGLTQ